MSKGIVTHKSSLIQNVVDKLNRVARGWKKKKTKLLLYLKKSFQLCCIFGVHQLLLQTN